MPSLSVRVQIIAVVAPLLGLLGTVSGMIQSFVAIESYGTGNPQLLSAGISEALLTTQFGLALAIPALFAHAFLNRLAERIIESFHYGSLLVLNQISQRQISKITQTTESAETQSQNVSLVESA